MKKLLAIVAVAGVATLSQAAQIWKAGSTGNLNDPNSWWTTESGTTNPASIGTTDALRFGGSGQAATITSIALGGDLAVGGIRLDNGTGTPNYSVTIAAGNTLTLNGASAGDIAYANGGVVLNSGTGGTLTMNCDVALGAAQQWVTSRNFTVGGTINLNSYKLSLNAAGGNQTMSGVISGTGSIERITSSGGLVYLSNANTYQGGTTLTVGAICIGNSASLGTGTVTFNGGILSSWTAAAYTLSNAVAFTGNGTIGNNLGTGTLTFSNTVNLGGATRTLTAQVASAVFNGVVSNGGINKAGAATLTLGNIANTYTGVTQVQGGTLSVAKLANGGANSSIGASSNAATNLYLNGGTLTYTGSSDSTDRLLSLGAAGVINNNGSGALDFTNTGAITHVNTAARNLTLQGSYVASANTFALRVVDGTAGTSAVTTLRINGGTWNITGNNAHTGGTTLMAAAGVLNIGNVNALGTGTFTVTGNGSFNNTTGSALAVANALTLSASPTFIGTNDMTINGAVTMTTANRTLTVNANTLTLGGAVGDGGSGLSLTKAGAGTLVLSSGSSSYTGGTTISAGTLSFANDALGTAGNITMNGGTLQWNGTNTQNISSRLTFANGKTAVLDTNGNTVALTTGFGGATTGSLAKIGAGTLTLSGINTYTGATSVNNGTLEITGTGALTGTLSVSVASGATLKNDGTVAGPLTVASGGTLSGSGTVSGFTTIVGTHKPGSSPGTQSFSAGLTYDVGSVLEWEFSGDALSTRGTDYDGINITGGDLTMGDPATFRIINYLGTAVDYTAAAWDMNRTFNVISLTGGGSVLGTLFTLDDTTSAPGSQGAWSLVSNAGGVDLK